MMLETLFAHQSQEQAFLSLMLCGLVLGLMLHIGTSLRRGHPLLSSIWDVLTALLGGGMALAVMLRYRTGLRAYGMLGILLGILLYLAGLAQPLHALEKHLQKDKNSRRPKAGKPQPDDESTSTTG